jgi:hypothetical protein
MSRVIYMCYLDMSHLFLVVSKCSAGLTVHVFHCLDTKHNHKSLVCVLAVLVFPYPMVFFFDGHRGRRSPPEFILWPKTARSFTRDFVRDNNINMPQHEGERWLNHR